MFAPILEKPSHPVDDYFYLETPDTATPDSSAPPSRTHSSESFPTLKESATDGSSRPEMPHLDSGGSLPPLSRTNSGIPISDARDEKEKEYRRNRRKIDLAEKRKKMPGNGGKEGKWTRENKAANRQDLRSLRALEVGTTLKPLVPQGQKRGKSPLPGSKQNGEAANVGELKKSSTGKDVTYGKTNNRKNGFSVEKASETGSKVDQSVDTLASSTAKPNGSRSIKHILGEVANQAENINVSAK